MKKIIKKSYLLLFLFILKEMVGSAQSVPQGITYQGLAHNSMGLAIANQNITVKLGIYSTSVSGTLQWEETHALTTSSNGLFYFIIGQGTTTGAGAASSFSAINWGAASHFLKIAMDSTGGSAYVDIDTIQFWSVPYSLNSQTSNALSQPLRLNDLIDVDTIGVATGYVLKYNGSLWVPAPDNDSDTALYAYNSLHSIHSDTADYALHFPVVDTVLFSHNSDSASYSAISDSAISAVHSQYSDTAFYALNCPVSDSCWNLTGNSGTNPSSDFIGTKDNADFVMKTHSIERMRITTTGKIGIGTSTPIASLHIIGNDGLVAEGTLGTGATPPAGTGIRMVWYPKKAAFRAGGIDTGGTGGLTTMWNDARIGNYSFATNKNTVASGDYSSSFGNLSTASGMYSTAAGYSSIASGISSVAIGSVCNATGAYSISLGRGANATDSGSICLGYHSYSPGKYSLSFGTYDTARGDYSIVMGYKATSNGHKGCFVFSDSTGGTSGGPATRSTADDQFMVRAGGGAIFYSAVSPVFQGVILPAGGGAWSSVSDRNKKENFKRENSTDVLRKLSEMEITSWNYKTQDKGIRHIGPMAQDMYAAFKMGESDTTITTVDIDGISLLAIQELAKKTKELKAKADEVEQLKLQVAKLSSEKARLEKRVTIIENKLGKGSNQSSCPVYKR